MTPLEVLRNHFVGLTIVGGDLHSQHFGKKILSVHLDDYEPMLEFILESGGKVESITVLFEWKIEVA
jgi:hypothetical protein